jgi:hypothetical protein
LARNTHRLFAASEGQLWVSRITVFNDHISKSFWPNSFEVEALCREVAMLVSVSQGRQGAEVSSVSNLGSSERDFKGHIHEDAVSQ